METFTTDNMKTLGKPEPHSDVVYNQPRTLLIGYGWVGQFVGKYFTEALWTDENGQLRKVSDDSESINDKGGFDEVFDLAFIGVPTPMLDDGYCDISYVEAVVEKWKDRVSLFIIRSTVTPGTTEYLSEKYNVDIIFQPEYVGETIGHPNTEPRRDPFIILGGKPKLTELAVQYWSTVLNANATYYQLSAIEAEIVKYMENSFLATKVLFVNDFARLCDEAGADFYKVREAWLADPRIGRSHSMAVRGNPGFSGKCLPKDLNAITQWAREQIGQPLELIEEVLKINAKMRENCVNTVPLLPKDRQ